MKTLRSVMIVFLITGASLAFTGDIQIICEPGLSIYRDGNFARTSNAKQDGLFLIDVRRGPHTIRVEKQGFLPQSVQVEVSDFPIEVRISALIPDPAAGTRTEVEARPEERSVGNLVITSAPQNCTVEIDGRVEVKGRRLTETVMIRDEMRTELEASFIKGDKPFSVSYVPY